MKTLNLEDFKHKPIHFIGIGGSSMSGLAQLLRGQGYCVRGDDRVSSHATEKLQQQGITVTIGHAAQNVHGAGLVVYSAAIAKDNVERMECVRLGIPQMERSELLGQLAKAYTHSISVCGTHGKTTVTSMLSTVLLGASLDPTIHIGGEMDLIGGSVHSGKGDTFVTEACEFNASFLTLYPTLALVLNIDADHLDFYRDIEHIEDTFAQFLNQITPGGVAILCGDNQRTKAMASRIAAKSITYGIEDTSCDYTAIDVSHDEFLHYSFTPVEHGTPLARITLSVAGYHNALNALGVVATARHLGLSGECIAQQIHKFAGAHRRFELTATVDGVKLYHDYGHNPVEFHTVIPLADAVAGDHHLFVVCQPHTYSRTKLLFNDYLTCFEGADTVLITDIYAAREKDPGDIHATMLVDALKAKGVPVVYTPDFDACERYLRANWHKGDVMITLGCGNINLLNEQIAK